MATLHLVDDRELSRRLRSAPGGSDGIYTTGCWYVRLCQAVVRSRGGVLSAPLLRLSPARREVALRAILELPSAIGLVSLRDLAPRVGQMRTQHRLNLLSAEALAAAVHLGADVHLSAPAPHLEAALKAHGCHVHRLYESDL